MVEKRKKPRVEFLDETTEQTGEQIEFLDDEFEDDDSEDE